jgi:hypothetical protein
VPSSPRSLRLPRRQSATASPTCSKPTSSRKASPTKTATCGPERVSGQSAAKWSRSSSGAGKSFVDELSRKTMEGYRDWLLTEGKNGKPYEADTIYNKLMVITTFVKKNNATCPLEKALLPAAEFPDKKSTQPDPYTVEEFDRFMEAASYEDALLFYFLICGGMRNMETAVASRGDINFGLGEISIVKKRSLGFLGKRPQRCATCRCPPTCSPNCNCVPRACCFLRPRAALTDIS